MNSKEILDRLTSGNERFVADKLNNKFEDSKRREELISGQNPFAIILSCADSRVVPEILFDTGLGELFTIRVAGNVANKSSIASIEYAVANLNTKVIVVLGHQNCGVIKAAIQGGDNGENLNHLLHHIKPAIQEAGSRASVNEVVEINAKLTAGALKENSEIIRNAVDNSELMIISAYYKLESGRVLFNNNKK